MPHPRQLRVHSLAGCGINLVTAIALVTVLTACSVAKVDADRARHSTVTSCCADTSSLPAPQAFERALIVELNPSTPHFDFGMGLAPFARLALTPGAVTVLEVRAYPRGSGTLFGGDGTFHYANAQLRFFDGNGQPIPYVSPEATRIDTVGLAGHYALISEVTVPADATTLLLTSDARSFGEQSEATANEAGRMVMVSGLFIWVPERDRRTKYTLSPYGKVEVIAR